MKIGFLFLLFFAGTLGGHCFSKLSSNRIGGSGGKEFPLFFVVNGTIACLFFLISGGLRLQWEGITLLFALIYAGVVLLSLYSNMMVLQRMPIAYVSISSGAATLLLTALLGVVLFREQPSWQTAARIGLMLAASALIFAERRGSERPSKGFLLPLLGYVAAAVSNYLVLKLYSLAPHRASDSTLFFFTNLILVMGAAGWLLLRRQPIRLSWRGMIPFAANTLCSNLVSLVSLVLIARTEAGFYNPVSSALGTLCVMVASLLFKEKIGVRACLAAGLAIIAVMI